MTQSQTFAMRSVGLALLFAGCTASSSAVAPPQFDPYYPTAVTISPDEKYLFVESSNSDLRYDSGTVQVLDLDKIDAIIAAWNPFGGNPPRPTCKRDTLFQEILVCDSSTNGTPADFVLDAVKIGDFGSSLGIQTIDSSHLRLFSTVRGDPSLTWVDFDEGSEKLDCGGAGTFQRCDAKHRLDQMRNDDADFGGLTVEPFQLYVDSGAERVFITHLTSGRVTVASAPKDGSPRLESTLTGIWAPNRQTGGLGACGITARQPGDPDGWVYVTSVAEARLALVRATQGTNGLTLVRGPSYLYSAAFGGLAVDGSPGDARSIKFTPDGNRAFLVSRLPAAILEFDTSMDATGVPKNELLATTEICDQPSQMVMADLGEGLRGFVPCFANGQVWVVDLDRMELVDAIDVGKGTTSITVSPTRKRVYVTDYADDTVAVIDVDPASPTKDHTVLRVGKPRENVK
jgi:DNA-binding beta-propeller fold protein YncE